jgi:hypothetical protein
VLLRWRQFIRCSFITAWRTMPGQWKKVEYVIVYRHGIGVKGTDWSFWDFIFVSKRCLDKRLMLLYDVPRLLGALLHLRLSALTDLSGSLPLPVGLAS